MGTYDVITSQYDAALEMLRQAVENCPDSLWYSQEYNSPFWHVAYHTLFYTHLYLQSSAEDFVPWAKHREGTKSLGSSRDESEVAEPYSKEEVLAYHALCCQQVAERVPSLDLAAESGFYWLPCGKLELQIYNIRHIQQHTGELYERLGAAEGIEVGWVGMKAG